MSRPAEIYSSLEANRLEDLKAVLERLTSQILEYAETVGVSEPHVGLVESPDALESKLDLDLPIAGGGREQLHEDVRMTLKHSLNTWNEGFMDKLYASTNPVGIAADMLLSVLNTNVHVYRVSPVFTLMEKKVAHEYAKLFGFSDADSGGITMPGGSYSNFTSLHIARTLLHPDTKKTGMVGTAKLAIFTSSHSHYSLEKAAIFCGFGSDALIRVPVNGQAGMDVEALKSAIEKAKQDGMQPFFVNATAGTTVYGSFDDLDAIADVTEKEGMWLHVDGSWGGNFIFSEKHRHKLKGSQRANSLTVNPHKMLGVPTVCSFLLLPKLGLARLANSLNAPYLFHGAGTDSKDLFDLADATMGCGRRPDAVKLFLAWRWYGSAGFGERIDHAHSLATYFADKLEADDRFKLISENPPPCLQICFYYTPARKLLSPEQNTATTRAVSDKLQQAGTFLVDFAPGPYGEFLRVVVNSPIVSSRTMDMLMEQILACSP